MHINLADQLFKLFNRCSVNFTKLKIIKVLSHSTLISLKKKQFEIPLKLDLQKQYFAKINNGILEIREKEAKNFQKIFDQKSQIDFLTMKNILKESLFHSDEFQMQSGKLLTKENIFFYLNQFLNENFDSEYHEELRNNNFHCQSNDKKEYYFFLTLPFYNYISKIFLKIDENYAINLFIYSNKLDQNVYSDFKHQIDGDFLNRKTNIFINLFDDKDEFINKVAILMKNNNVDLRI
jgi:hypothetical protein